MTKAATLDADKDLPITDAHRHLWNLNGIRYPWLDAANTKKFLGDYASIMRNYMPDDCRHDFAAPNAIKSVHVEAECDHDTQVAETT